MLVKLKHAIEGHPSRLCVVVGVDLELSVLRCREMLGSSLVAVLQFGTEYVDC